MGANPAHIKFQAGDIGGSDFNLVASNFSLYASGLPVFSHTGDREPILTIVFQCVSDFVDGQRKLVISHSCQTGHFALNDLLRIRVNTMSGFGSDNVNQVNSFFANAASMTSAACFWMSFSPL